jgi:hypothetical protein
METNTDTGIYMEIDLDMDIYTDMDLDVGCRISIKKCNLISDIMFATPSSVRYQIF